jgi:uncharacterized membrane protein YgdD (TMEM256/DUF423 family)
MPKLWLGSAAVFGFLSVALGAFGAHSLKHFLDDYGRAIWEKAVLYQMFHAMALLAVGVVQHLAKETSFSPSGWGFLAGTVLFSGSLYVLAVTGIKWLGAITPIGGVAFLFGWLYFVAAIIKARLQTSF